MKILPFLTLEESVNFVDEAGRLEGQLSWLGPWADHGQLPYPDRRSFMSPAARPRLRAGRHCGASSQAILALLRGACSLASRKEGYQR